MNGYCLLTPEFRTLVIISVTLAALSLLVFEFTPRRRLSIYMLMAGALVAGFLFAVFNPYLHMWDEQYHMLVAKNMMDNPFKPMLYRDAINDYRFESWISNEVWLHKQPLFLWQMALSMSVFGVNEIGARLPSVVMHAGMVLLIYRIGRIAVNPRTGFYAALLYAFAHYPLELISGAYCNDHNDKAFIFYITASFWALFEYRTSQKPKFMYLVGILAGCAVLCKWLAGFLVFGPWFLSLFFFSQNRRWSIKTYLPFLKAFGICLLVVLPWQIYTLIRFPNEANYELFHAASHFTEPVEGHSGDLLFHFEALRILISDYEVIYYIVPASLILLFFRAAKKEYFLIVILAVLAVYGFFTAACTKMDSFTAIASPLIFISIAALLEFPLSLIYRNRKSYVRAAVTTVIIITAGYFSFNPEKSFANHTEWDEMVFNYRNAKIREAFFLKSLNKTLGEGNYAVYNSSFNLMSHISGMFYTPYICFPGLPTAEQIKEAKAKGYKVAVLKFNEELPLYITENRDVRIVYIPYYNTFTYE
jgi:4-amino-4-deoxy-L-arabinose transferase